MPTPTEPIGSIPRPPERSAGGIPHARQKAEEELVQAKVALELRTQELSHSLSLMRATFESTADGILVTEHTVRVVTFNEQFLQIWGLPRESVEGATHADLVQHVMHLFREPARLAGRIEDIYRSPGAEVLDTLELADGRVFERFSRSQSVEGAVVGRVWSYRDITARRRVEDAVRDEARVLDLLNRTGATIASTLDLTTLLQTVTDAATLLSGAEFGVFFYNAAREGADRLQLYTVSGVTRDEFDASHGPHRSPLFPPAFDGDAPLRLADATRGHPQSIDAALVVRSYLAVPVASRGGESVGALCFGHSKANVFTERTQRVVVGIAAQASVAVDNARLFEEARRVAAERERLIEAERAARSDIARVSRLKDEFLATLSHELRTPLTAILGWAKVLLRKTGDVDTLAKGLDAIERNAVAQARLIDDLLDMNRIISGKVRLDVQPTDLSKVIEAAVDSVRPAADGKEIRLRTVIDPIAGPVSGDPNRLQQVVWNLLTNAVKFTPKGGNVDVVLQRVNSQLELSVSDSGVGIPADFLPHVFDRFRQADSSSTRSHGGLGLGLSIVKQLVELHGGSVRARSNGQGQGASFVVCLPPAATRSHAGSQHAAASGDKTALAMDVDLRGIKVLVVDDEPDARDLIGQLLEECNAEVSTAESVSEALAMMPRVRPDLLVSDIGMPEHDGYQLIRDIRRLPPEFGGRTPAIALTAFARSEDRTRAMLAGYQIHVSKPIEPHELVAAVASLTGRMGGNASP